MASKWKMGGCYRHKAIPRWLIHVVGTLPTDLYGEIHVAESTNGTLVPLPDEHADQWEEVKPEEWASFVDKIRNPDLSERPKLVEVLDAPQ